MELQDIVAGSATDMYCTSQVKCFINRGVSCDLLHLQHAEAHFLFLSEQSSAEGWNLGASLGLLGLGFASMNAESSTRPHCLASRSRTLSNVASNSNMMTKAAGGSG